MYLMYRLVNSNIFLKSPRGFKTQKCSSLQLMLQACTYFFFFPVSEGKGQPVFAYVCSCGTLMSIGFLAILELLLNNTA